MQISPYTLLAAIAALSLSSQGVAQNDDCTGAISIAYGVNGPFSNVGSTTSSPAWPCAAGANDVWFVYVAPGAGSLTIDLCGATWDTALQFFDGNLGCGGLVSIGCNDDSCGLQSLLTATVNQGDTVYVRVGGFAGQTGTFSMNVVGPTGSGTVATSTSYGVGCVSRPGSFYEVLQASTFDLNGVAMTMLPTAPGYVVLPLGAYLAPSASATALALSDDSEVTQALAMPFPYDGGSANALTVCSNGFVSVSTGNGTGYVPNVPNMLNGPATGWWSQSDFNPTGASGVVKFEEIAGIAYVTWDGVYSYGGTNPNTFQMQFDSNSGIVTMVWQSMNASGASTTQDILVGYSAGGPSIDPGAIDISVALPATFTVFGADVLALALASSARPIAGNSINMNTTNITPTAPFGAVALGFTNPALPLASLGMDGCTQYADHLAVLLFLPLGATNFSVPLTVPNAIGVTVLAQSFVYDPGVALTQLGAIASNGVSLLIGNL